MGTTLRTGIVAVAAVMTLPLAGCSSTIAGQAVAPFTAGPRLDTGNYPTVPQVIGPARRPADAYQQEGWKIADAVISVSDVDPRLTRVYKPPWPLVATRFLHSDNLPNFTDQQADELGGYNLLTGFIASRADTEDGTGTWASAGILRFRDADSAERALAAISPPDAASSPVPQFPGARVVLVRGGKVADGRTVTSTVLRRDDLWVVAAAVGPDMKTITTTAVKALKAQYDRLGEYRPTVITDTADYPMDPDSVMRLLLPPAANQVLLEWGLSAEGGVIRGYRTGRAESHYWEVGSTRYRQSLSPQTQVVATSGDTSVNRVTRLDSEATARDRLDSAYPVAAAPPAGGTPDPGGSSTAMIAGSVPGIDPQVARCASIRGFTVCGVQVGRYLEEVAAKSPQKARQQIAAAYLILQQAGE